GVQRKGRRICSQRRVDDRQGTRKRNLKDQVRIPRSADTLPPIAMRSTRLASIALLVVASGCAPDASVPRRAAPGALRSVTAPPVSGAVGSTLASPFIVSVSDSSGNPLSGVPVLFAVTVGNGSVSP